MMSFRGLAGAARPSSRLMAKVAVASFLRKTAVERARDEILGVLGRFSREITEKSAENDQKSAENGQKLAKNPEIVQKTAENCQKSAKTTENCQKSAKTTENCQKSAKMTKKVVGMGEIVEKRDEEPEKPGKRRSQDIAAEFRGKCGAGGACGSDLGKSAGSVSFGGPVDVVFRDGRTGHVKCAAALEVACTPETRAAGLSKRAGLEPGHGMFFDCNGPFWMKDVEFPLDLVFLDGGGRVTEKVAMPVDMEGNALHKAASALSENAVELPSGYCDMHGLSAGDFIEILGD